MKESDWKVFNEIKEKAIERFCQQCFDEFEEIINDKNERILNNFMLLTKLVQNRDKQLTLFFEPHSRSKAKIQLIAIRSEGLVDESLLKKLSEEFLKSTEPDLHGW